MKIHDALYKDGIMGIYDFSVRAQDGAQVSLEAYRGKVLLIVNTATGCGFTPQYTGLQELYDKYKDKGLEILDFPCDQFGHQAPGSDQEIHSFCTGRFAITFPQFSKVKVNGPDAEPLFTFLKERRSGVLGGAIKWNFTKFLVGRNGEVLRRFAPTDTPAKMEEAVRQALADDRANPSG